jgi:hypothetical protein
MRWPSRWSKGLTILELLVGVALLAIAGGALLAVLARSRLQAAYLGQIQFAVQVAQGELEQLMAVSFDALSKGSGFLAARQDGMWVAAASTEGMPEVNLWVRIRGAEAGNPADVDPDLLDIVVSACWTSFDRRIGEDQDCDGIMDAGEDRNGNGWLDSPAMVSTRLGRG